ncbi:MAG: YveK family protein [Clostridia bacterium]
MEDLDLKELFNIFWERKLEILLIILIFIVIGAVYSYAILKPEYTSYTTLLLTQVTNNNSEDNTSITQTDLSLNSKLVSTYSELIKSNAVLREVINNLNIKNLNEENLKSSIKVSAVTDTEMIKISVTNENPNYAEIIANKIAEVFSEKIADIYKINNVYVVDRAEVSEVPSNINHTKDIVIFTFIGIVVACGYVLLVNMLDNTVKTEADIEKITGLKVLASIPDYDTEVKGGKR